MPMNATNPRPAVALSKRYIRRGAVVDKTGLSASTIYLLEKKGEFPRHVLLTPRCAAWDEAEIDRWLEERAARMVVPPVTPRRTVRFSAAAGKGQVVA